MADITYLSVPLEAATIEASVPSSEISAKSLSYVSGADGRYVGGIRRHPGFESYNLLFASALNVPALYPNIETNRVTLNIIPFQILSIDNNYTVRGYIIHYRFGSPTVYKIGMIWVSYPHSNPNASIISSADITSHLTSVQPTTTISATFSNNKLFIVGDETFARTLYVKDGSKTSFTDAWNVSPLGAGPYAAVPPAPSEQSQFVSSTQSHFLFGAGRYQIAWRLRSSIRNVVSALSYPLNLVLDARTSSRALGYIYISGTADETHDGLFIDGDVVRIGSVYFEFDTDDSVNEGNVRINISGLTSLSQQMQRFADVINATASCPVSATAGDISVSLIAKQPGPDGNTIVLSKQEAGSKTQDIQLSGATLTDGGRITNIPEPYCGAYIKLPPVSSLLSAYGISSYSDLKSAWDTIEIFRTINLGDRVLYAQISGYLYRETEVAVPETSSDWDDLVITVGTVDDQSLLFRPYYNPSTDVCRRIHHAKSVVLFKDTLFLASSTSDNGGRFIYYSNPRVAGSESFTAYHIYECSPQEGVPTNLLPAGETMLITCSNCIIQAQLPIETGAMLFTPFHYGKSFPKGAAHIVGNLMYAVNQQGVFVCNTQTMDLAYMLSSHRLFANRNVSFENASCAYDQQLDASFFAVGGIGILSIYHTTQTLSLLYPTPVGFLMEAPFRRVRDLTLAQTRNLILILAPNNAGIECALSSGTTIRSCFLNHVLMHNPVLTYEIVSATSNTITLKKRTGNVLNENYASILPQTPFTISSGKLAGKTGLATMLNYPSSGDTFTIFYSSSHLNLYHYKLSAGDHLTFWVIPLMVQLPDIKTIAHAQFPAIPIRELTRVVLTSIAFQTIQTDSKDFDISPQWVVNAARNFQEPDGEANTLCPVSTNPSTSVCAVRLDGFSLEPYILCAYPLQLELTSVDLGCIISRSRKTE